ncbi:MAG: hypothetical protein F6K28_06755 [Microcoleus sp. SIO2G3]|nr:hypothetical protein [Microcoleus sp. SIO2G3]
MKTENAVLGKYNNGLSFFGHFNHNQVWKGDLDCVAFEPSDIKEKLQNLHKPCYIVRVAGKIGVTNEGYSCPTDNGTGQVELLIAVPPISTHNLGDSSFLSSHGVKYAYATGAMAGGIASEEMVIALGKEKILGSFGAGGLSPDRLEAAINRIQQALPQGPYASNLIHSPNEPAIERRAVDIYLKYGVKTVLIRLASEIKVKPLHYVSSVAVFESPAYAGKVVKEQDNFDHWEGIYLGYSQTKWVAEKLVKIAGERGLPITIHRPPLIAGHSETGVSNTHDFTNLMIKGCLDMGCFPDVDYMLDMSPVDYVSKAIVYLSRQKESIGKAFHLQHPEPVSLKMLVEWMRSFGFPIQMLPYDEWQALLMKNATSVENPLYTLRPFLFERWSQEGLTIPDLYLQARRPIISCQETLDALAGSSIVCPPIDSKLFITYSSYLIETGFLNVA